MYAVSAAPSALRRQIGGPYHGSVKSWLACDGRLPVARIHATSRLTAIRAADGTRCEMALSVGVHLGSIAK